MNKQSSSPTIYSLQFHDLELLADKHFPWITREQTIQKWSNYLREQQEGMRMSFLIKWEDQICGYGNLINPSEYPLFQKMNIPEINDLWIFEPYRQKGLGSLLIHHFEKLAQQQGYKQIGLGVGLYQDYGPAQKLYFRLGYTPDGNGVTYKGQGGIPGENYCLDDDFILWLIKKLK